MDSIYPISTKAVHHVIRGLELMKNPMYDQGWDDVATLLIPWVVNYLGIEEQDWDAVCDILERVGSHLEERAAANLAAVAAIQEKQGSSGEDEERGESAAAALRASRERFLEHAIGLKHHYTTIYLQDFFGTKDTLQQSDYGEAGVNSATKREKVMMPRMRKMLSQAAQLLLSVLPPSREYAASPEMLTLFSCEQRSYLFLRMLQVSPPDGYVSATSSLRGRKVLPGGRFKADHLANHRAIGEHGRPRRPHRGGILPHAVRIPDSRKHQYGSIRALLCMYVFPLSYHKLSTKPNASYGRIRHLVTNHERSRFDSRRLFKSLHSVSTRDEDVFSNTQSPKPPSIL